MKIGKRNFKQLSKALCAKQHYTAFVKMFLICQHPFECFIRYFLGRGHYPASVTLRTPLGKISPEVYSYYDILTINEIFFRTDYKVNKNIDVVVDIGSNIGISALYFLTRNSTCKCYLFEPDPDNILKLKKNLQNFKDRFVLKECAVASITGVKQFGRDPTGRCGGLNRKTEDYIKVECFHINDLLNNILSSEDKIDILKIDIEGDEIDVLQSIDKKNLNKINIIYFEIDHTINISPNFSFYPDLFIHKKRGETYMLINKNI